MGVRRLHPVTGWFCGPTTTSLTSGRGTVCLMDTVPAGRVSRWTATVGSLNRNAAPHGCCPGHGDRDMRRCYQQACKAIDSTKGEKTLAQKSQEIEIAFRPIMDRLCSGTDGPTPRSVPVIGTGTSFPLGRLASSRTMQRRVCPKVCRRMAYRTRARMVRCTITTV